MKMVTDDDAALIIKALDHYADFLRATGRDDRSYREVIARIQPERKAPAREEPLVITPRRKKR